MPNKPAPKENKKPVIEGERNRESPDQDGDQIPAKAYGAGHPEPRPGTHLPFSRQNKCTIKEVLAEARKRNPYPSDVFISKTGRFANSVWNNCIDEIRRLFYGEE